MIYNRMIFQHQTLAISREAVWSCTAGTQRGCFVLILTVSTRRQDVLWVFTATFTNGHFSRKGRKGQYMQIMDVEGDRCYIRQ